MLRTWFAASVLLLPLTVHAVDGPRLQNVVPNRGPTSGGTAVELIGENFNLLQQGVLGVLFGSTPATDVVLVSANLITAVTPSHIDDSIYVRLTVNGVVVPAYGRRRFYFEGSGGSTTSTTSTLPGATTSTTSTTLPCGGCADGDACTIDACVNLSCQHRNATTLTDLVGQASACAGDLVPPRVGERFILGCDLVREGRATPDQNLALRRFKAAVRSYSRALRIARRVARRNALTATCAEQLSALLDSARVRARALKGS